MVNGQLADLQQARVAAGHGSSGAECGRVSDVVTSVPRNTSRTAGSARTVAGSPSPMNRPAGQAEQPVHRGGQGPHHVLDPDDGDAVGADRGDDLDELSDLRIGQAARYLVQQQQPRAGGQRPGQLEPLALQQPEALGLDVGLASQAGPVQDPGGSGVARPAPQPGALLGGDEHVLEHGHVPERPRHLERPPDAEPAPGGGVQPGDRVPGEGDLAGCRRRARRR